MLIIFQMDSISFSKKAKLHEKFIAEAYHSYLCDEAKNLMTFILQDNCIIKNVNSSMFRVFSPLINSILQDFPDSSVNLDIFLPDFSEESFRHLIEVLTFGYSKVGRGANENEIKGLAECLNIPMDSLFSIGEISQICNTLPNICDAKNELNNKEENIKASVL